MTLAHSPARITCAHRFIATDGHLEFKHLLNPASSLSFRPVGCTANSARTSRNIDAHGPCALATRSPANRPADTQSQAHSSDPRRPRHHIRASRETQIHPVSGTPAGADQRPGASPSIRVTGSAIGGRCPLRSSRTPSLLSVKDDGGSYGGQSATSSYTLPSGARNCCQVGPASPSSSTPAASSSATAAFRSRTANPTTGPVSQCALPG